MANEKELKDVPKYGKDGLLPTYVKSGMFLTFKYSSKLFEEDKLEYFDAQPLILVLGKSGDYILGLNFHYIPSSIREQVMKRLKNRYKVQWESGGVLPNISWGTVQRELMYTNYMVHLYLIPRIMSKIQRIKNTEMEKKFIYARSEDFIGIKAEAIWRHFTKKA
jgi:hypothetical protein